jgi:hypothetical protein
VAARPATGRALGLAQPAQTVKQVEARVVAGRALDLAPLEIQAERVAARPAAAKALGLAQPAQTVKQVEVRAAARATGLVRLEQTELAVAKPAAVVVRVLT